MTIDRKTLRWNGWGPADYTDPLAGNIPAWEWMCEVLGLERLPSTPAKDLGEIQLPPSRLTGQPLTDLQNAIGADHVRLDPYERAFHARGKSYVDLLALRAGNLAMVPDAVVYPGNPLQVFETLRFADTHGFKVIPFGGGSSVVGGVNAVAPADATGILTLDLTRMNRVLTVDEEALTAVVETGIYGPALEEALNKRGFTLGHFPQSFEYSTLGGWIAARGAGQQSNRYGKPEDWVVGAKLASPAGLWATECFPASAAGPSLTDLVIGSEGRLGILTEATIRIHPIPEARDYRGFLFRSFAEGAAAVRALAQSDLPIAMTRLSDADETHFLRAFSSLGRNKDPEAVGFLERGLLSMRKFPDRPCLLLVGIEGDKATVQWARERSRQTLTKHACISLGTKPGERWYERRFATPYARDPMLDRGLGVDTLETATRWSNLMHLYTQVRTAIKEAMAETMPSKGARGLVLAHVSHSYADGASLYFTYVFPRNRDNEREQWKTIKTAASEAIVEHGGTISHHHGVGTDHAKWMMEEKGPAGMGVLKAVRHVLDPHGVMNPSKLLPD